MNSKLFVRNLHYDTTEGELKELLEQFGDVKEIKLIKDRMTNKIKGFGFVDMATIDDAQKVIDELNGEVFNGRNLRIEEYKDMGNGNGNTRRVYPKNRDERFNHSW